MLYVRVHFADRVDVQTVTFAVYAALPARQPTVFGMGAIVIVRARRMSSLNYQPLQFKLFPLFLEQFRSLYY